MPLLDPTLAPRRRLKAGLVIAGLLGGAAFGVVLTRVGKLATGAPPATLANYVWNAVTFGVLAAVLSPVVSWTHLRRVPLWRTIAEPLLGAAGAAAAALLLGVPVLVLVLPPVGLVLGWLNLRRRYPEPDRQIVAPPTTTALPRS